MTRRLRQEIPVYAVAGGQGGIRTLDTLLAYTHFPGVRLQPLGHLSFTMILMQRQRGKHPSIRNRKLGAKLVGEREKCKTKLRKKRERATPRPLTIVRKKPEC